MASWQEFSGLNRGYVLDLYDKYRQDPDSVDAESRAIFEQWTPPVEDAPAPAAGLPLQKIVGAVNLAQSIRRYGHLAAQLDPLGSAPVGDPSLLPETHGVTNEDLRALPATLLSTPLAEHASNMLELVELFRQVYCSRTGYDISHVFVPEERRWLRQAGARPRRDHRRRGRGRHPQHPDRDGSPRTSQCDGARARQAVLPDPGGV